MKITFPWLGEEDTVNLEHVRHMRRMHGVACALNDIPIGELWPMEDILRLKESIEAAGLSFDAVEILPVHEDIKLRRGDYKRFLENYRENIVRLSKAGAVCVCYNFTPAFNAAQSIIARELAEGPKFETDDDPADFPILVEDLTRSARDDIPEETSRMLDDYRALGSEGLWRNYGLFIKEIMPTAASVGVNMAIHPDELPETLLRASDLPSLASTEEDIDRLLSCSNDKHHGIVMCTGSFSHVWGPPSTLFDDYARMITKYAGMGRVHFAHVRDVKISEDGYMLENAHISPYDSQDVERLLAVFFNSGYKGCFRYDHRRMTVTEDGTPTYGLYDRIVGAMFLTGVMITLETRLKMAS
ncbi:MAG: mannonate dehydratase [Synergistaceae bacterium]|nr:mannonate dehydratase [Synergistaceae bacterium]